MILDINSDLLQLRPPEKFSLALASSITTDEVDSKNWDYTTSPHPHRQPKQTLMDRWDYVMYGRVFKIKEEGSSGQHTLKMCVTAHVY